jgi:hypothetical protein
MQVDDNLKRLWPSQNPLFLSANNQKQGRYQQGVPSKSLQASSPAGLSHKAVMTWEGSAGNEYIDPTPPNLLSSRHTKFAKQLHRLQGSHPPNINNGEPYLNRESNFPTHDSRFLPISAH